MDTYVGRVALVTGASAGIGAKICELLVKHGMTVVGAARRIEKIREAADLLKDEKGTLIPACCDIALDDNVHQLFKFVNEKFGGIDVCINNAGLISHEPLLSDSTASWRRLLDVNVVGLCLCSQLAFKSMQEKGSDDGYIINIGSVAGHVVHDLDTLHFYMGTKFAVRALTEGLRQEIKQRKSGIRVSLISPGPVSSEMTEQVSSDSTYGKALATGVSMEAIDVAKIVLQLLTSDPRVEVNDVILTPAKISY